MAQSRSENATPITLHIVVDLAWHTLPYAALDQESTYLSERSLAGRVAGSGQIHVAARVSCSRDSVVAISFCMARSVSLHLLYRVFTTPIRLGEGTDLQLAGMAADEGKLTTPTGRLRGRRCLITGAARGLGAEIASTFRAEGAAVALLDVDPAVKVVADRLDASGVEVVDLADATATAAAVAALIGALGGVDVLVNNAGILRITPLLDITVEEWDLVHAINTRSMLVTTQVAARAMIVAGHGGKIINLASMAAKVPAANLAHYAASKAAVVSLTQTAAVELGPHGITANSICPGFVLTDMGAQTRTDEMVASWRSMSPLGRLAEPSDVAAMALFLASSDGDYCTGQAMNVAGGMVMH